jgi:hypothetical protein
MGMNLNSISLGPTFPVLQAFAEIGKMDPDGTKYPELHHVIHVADDDVPEDVMAQIREQAKQALAKVPAGSGFTRGMLQRIIDGK